MWFGFVSDGREPRRVGRDGAREPQRLALHFAKVHLDFRAHGRSRLGVGVVGVLFEGGVVEDGLDLRRRAESSLSTCYTPHPHALIRRLLNRGLNRRGVNGLRDCFCFFSFLFRVYFFFSEICSVFLFQNRW